MIHVPDLQKKREKKEEDEGKIYLWIFIVDVISVLISSKRKICIAY